MQYIALIVSLHFVNAFAYITPEKTKVRQNLESKAADGDAKSQYQMGFNYLYGGAPFAKNYIEAHKWLRKAAEQGYAEAQCVLGDAYSNGYGVAVNFVEAVKWYRKAAEQGNTAGIVSLSDCYYRGKGIKINLVEAYALKCVSGTLDNRQFDTNELTPQLEASGQKRALELQKEIESNINKKATN